jgi:hypothetical protein
MSQNFYKSLHLVKSFLLATVPSVLSGQGVSNRALGFEPLEPRIALSAAGLVDIGTQPDGALSDKIVYAHGGHGYTADSPGSGAWSFQRPLLLDMIEDLGNQDQMSFFAEYLFQAGATVVPLRPVGHQSNEVVLDNDDTEVTFTGSWSDAASSVYFGDPGDVPFRFATASLTETATAVYRPNIPEAGFYPVYGWSSSGGNRATDQLYRIHHSGGATEVTVNHRRVGNGLVYLGMHHFEAGNEGYVEISNRSDDVGSVVIADMVRFGNGVGDISRGAGVSGRDREDEAGLYWVEWHATRSQGIPSSEYRATNDDRDATVSLSPRYSEFMNREADGVLSDRVFVSFHSNAGGGSARGVLGLYNGNSNPATATPQQFLLAKTLAQEVNDDLVAQNGAFEHNWHDRGTAVTLDRADIEFGEINNQRINDEFDATIIETGYHDNQDDAEMLRDPKVREALARASYQGLVKYFNVVDNGATSVVMLPGKATDIRAEAAGSGSVTVSWEPPAASSSTGDAPTGFMVYGSTNGYGFDGGTYVAGALATSHTFTGLDTSLGSYFFKVAAVNAGGESPSSEVAAATPFTNTKSILIVNGFDRLDRSLDPVQFGAQRARPRQSNSLDYAVQIAAGIKANSPEAEISSSSNEAVISGDILLGDYDAVVWILGEESSADSTFDSTEQGLVTSYLQAGGKLLVSGSETGWDLDNLNNGRTFYNDQLRADYVSDDAGTYDVQGNVGSIFEGLQFSFDSGQQFYNVDFPDVISATGGSVAAMTYSGGSGGTAGIQYDSGGSTKVVNLAFPIETITDAGIRNNAIGRVLEFFDFEITLAEVEVIIDNDQGFPAYTETGTWSTSSGTGYNGGTYQFAVAGNPSTATWQFSAPYTGSGEVFVQYRSGSNRTSDTVYQIETGYGTEQATANQKTNDLEWVSLGSFEFTAGSHSITLDAGASTGGSVAIADVVRILFTPPVTESADFNEDGYVDGSDFLIWQRGFGTASGAALSDGDGNGDSAVDEEDLSILISQYGMQAPLAAAASPLATIAAVRASSTEQPLSEALQAEDSTALPVDDSTLPSASQIILASLASAETRQPGPLDSAHQLSAELSGELWALPTSPLATLEPDGFDDATQLAHAAEQQAEEESDAHDLAFHAFQEVLPTLLGH